MRLGACVGLAALAVACGGSVSDSRRPRQARAPIAGGLDDVTHTGVLALALKNDPLALCSASLIAPNLVLTARHCVATAPVQVDCAQSRFAAPVAASDVIVAAD